MPTFAEWEAARKRQLPTVSAAAPVDEASHRYEPGLGDDYTSAAIHELGRTGKEAAIGLARSPLDIVKGILGIPWQVVSGYKALLDHPDPSLLLETPRAIKQGVQSLGENPREAGSLLGQLLLAPKLPEMADAALTKGPAVVGRGTATVGRGIEAAGKSKVAKIASKYGPMEAALRMDPWGIAAAVAPKVLELTGKGVQRVGRSIEGLRLSAGETAVPNVAEAGIDPEAAVVRETVDTARNLKAKGMSYKQAGQRAGWPLAKSAEVPYKNEAPTESLSGLRSAVGDEQNLRRNPQTGTSWAGDASAKTLSPEENARYDATDAAYAAAKLRAEIQRAGGPMEHFYQNDPQARIGGEGRMTGQFEEGSGGLSDVAAGRVTPHPMPDDPASSLADLSQKSGRSVSPRRMQELIDKFGGKGSSAAAALADSLGLPSDADVAASILRRNATGGWK